MANNVKKASRIAYGKEPVEHGPRYLVRTGKYSTKRKCFSWRYRYAMNLPDVKPIRDSAGVGAVVEVFSISYNFREAWEIKKA